MTTVRTPEQTEVARFWSANVTAQYNGEFRRIVATAQLDAGSAARLFAMGNLVGADSLISCFDAKYHYGSGARFVHTKAINIDLDSTVTGTTRHFATVGDLRTEIVNARVWGGLHYRTSGEVGVRMGADLARWALDRYFSSD